jgi:phosphoglycolate phosphatase
MAQPTESGIRDRYPLTGNDLAGTATSLTRVRGLAVPPRWSVPLADKRLVLWDIDHTLIDTGGVGREIYQEAFEQVTGRPMKRQADISGRTEPDIFRDTLALHDLEPSEESLERFADAMAAGYSAKMPLMRQRGHGLPGAAEALAALDQVPGIVQSVLTGNFKPVAITKLVTFGLDAHIDFDVGAYGSDDSVRAKLVEVARRRAATKYHTGFDQRATILVGDTPSDIAAGRDAGAFVIAVASGRSSMDELRAAEAEVVLQDLTDTDALINAILTSA